MKHLILSTLIFVSGAVHAEEIIWTPSNTRELLNQVELNGQSEDLARVLTPDSLSALSWYSEQSDDITGDVQYGDGTQAAWVRYAVRATMVLLEILGADRNSTFDSSPDQFNLEYQPNGLTPVDPLQPDGGVLPKTIPRTIGIHDGRVDGGISMGIKNPIIPQPHQVRVTEVIQRKGSIQPLTGVVYPMAPPFDLVPSYKAPPLVTRAPMSQELQRVLQGKHDTSLPSWKAIATVATAAKPVWVHKGSLSTEVIQYPTTEFDLIDGEYQAAWRKIAGDVVAEIAKEVAKDVYKWAKSNSYQDGTFGPDRIFQDPIFDMPGLEMAPGSGGY